MPYQAFTRKLPTCVSTQYFSTCRRGCSRSLVYNRFFFYTVLETILGFQSLYEGSWLFDMEYGCGIFLRKIRGCLWLIKSKEKLIIVTLTELLFQIDHVYC